MSNRPFAVRDGAAVSLVESPLTTAKAELSFEERCFGPEVARELRREDSEALAIISWILFVIVLTGCLLMLGVVAVVSL